ERRPARAAAPRAEAAPRPPGAGIRPTPPVRARPVRARSVSEGRCGTFACASGLWGLLTSLKRKRRSALYPRSRFGLGRETGAVSGRWELWEASMSGHTWILKNLAAYVAGGLDASERRRLERHAGRCAECARALDGARSVDRELTALFADVRPGPELEDEM